MKLTELKITQDGLRRARGDDFRTFLDDFVAALPQTEFPVGLTQ